MITQVYWVWLPCSDAMMRGSAIETIVLLIIATASASSRPESASSTSRWVIAIWIDQQENLALADAVQGALWTAAERLH